MTYHFTLIYRLPDLNTTGDDVIEKFGAAGKTDVLIGTGRDGIVAFEYSRQGRDAEAVVMEAMADIEEIIPRATLIESTAVTFSR